MYTMMRRGTLRRALTRVNELACITGTALPASKPPTDATNVVIFCPSWASLSCKSDGDTKGG